MRIRFTKMQGQGNDFIVLDGVRQRLELPSDLVRRLADRHFGIGCDQVLVVEPPRESGHDFRYRIWNADGGEVEQCGNGARCFARYVRDEGLTDKDEISVETARGVIHPRIEPSGLVTVDMGCPVFEPREIPFEANERRLTYPIEIEGRLVELGVLSMGNPHAVQVVRDIDAAPVTTQGPLIEHHPRFPRRVNAGYMQVIGRDFIRLRVWERGAGETLACGTGACAAVVTGVRRGLLDADVRVLTRGGELAIRWPGEDAPVMMTGDAVRVFQGEIDL
ncbi:MAG: diaminopimelate epimerase [Betaproteobacteria bacterium]|nr:diaminopimelate epimerase [Betaproteobacteria bacterium]